MWLLLKREYFLPWASKKRRKPSGHGEITIGDNSGDGTHNPSSAPQQVPGLSCVVQIEMGGNHCMVLLADGTVKSWGENYFDAQPIRL